MVLYKSFKQQTSDHIKIVLISKITVIMSYTCNVNLLNQSTGQINTDYLGSVMNCVMGDSTIEVTKALSYLKELLIPKYSENTNTMMVMNKSFTSSSYVKDDLEHKKNELQHMNSMTRSSIHKVRYNYMQKQRKAAYYEFMSGVVQSLIVIVALSAVLASMHKLKLISAMWLGAGIMTMVALFLLVVAVLVKNNLTRRPDDWSKFYFAPNNPTAV